MSKVVFVRKAKRAAYNRENNNHQWEYILDQELTVIKVPNITFLDQLDMVIAHIKGQLPADETFTVLTTARFPHCIEELSVLHPEVSFLFPPILTLKKRFTRMFDERVLRAARNKNTLFIGSDASSDMGGDISAWAWVTDGVAASYATGVRESFPTHVAEFSGILHAIVDNRDTIHPRVHVYCDSMTALEAFQKVVMEGESVVKKQEEDYAHLQELIAEARQVTQVKNITTSWVRGHKNHRLNDAADSMSRYARHAYMEGKTDEEAKARLDIFFQLFQS
jgi:ribonuclease HI